MRSDSTRSPLLTFVPRRTWRHHVSLSHPRTLRNPTHPNHQRHRTSLCRGPKEDPSHGGLLRSNQYRKNPFCRLHLDQQTTRNQYPFPSDTKLLTSPTLNTANRSGAGLCQERLCAIGPTCCSFISSFAIFVNFVVNPPGSNPAPRGFVPRCVHLQQCGHAPCHPAQTRVGFP